MRFEKGIRGELLPSGATRIYIDIRDRSHDGDRVRETVGEARTPKQLEKVLDRARVRLAEIRTAIYGRTFVSDALASKLAAAERGPLFSDFSKTFISDYVKPNCKASSTYYDQQQRALLPFFKDMYLRQIGAADIDRFKAQRVAAGVGPSTIRKHLICLGTMFKIARRWRLATTNPMQDVEKPPEPKHRVRYLTADEWKRLDTAAPDWLRPMFTVAVLTGMRLKEVVGLRREHVDFKNELVYVPDDNKTDEPGALPMAGPVRDAIMAALAEQKKRATESGKVSPWIFADAAGEPYTSTRARNIISKLTVQVMLAAGIEGASFHTLRHTAGSWAAQSGESGVKVAELLRHKDRRTSDRYMHLRPAHLRDTVRALTARMTDAGEVDSENASKTDTKTDTPEADNA